jgi:hypothetical protein
MAAKFNKNEMKSDMQRFNKTRKQALIIVIAFYNLYICSPEQRKM